MRFAVTYNLEYVPEVHKTPQNYCNQILEQSVLLEKLGFDGVWYSEHHTGRYSFGNPAVMATAAAMRTSRIKVGTGVSLLPLHQPVFLAEEYALLDVLSGGRLEYGIGRGYLKHEYDWVGVPAEESHSRYHEIMDFLMRAWTEEGKIDFLGQHYQIKGYECFPKPIQKPFPAVYASAGSTMESFRWAGEKGLHLGTVFFLPDISHLPEGIASYKEALVANGHDPATREVMAITQMYCHENHETALRDGRTYANNYYRHFAKLGGVGPQNPVYAYYNEADSMDMNDRGQTLIGCPDVLCERIAGYERDYGLDYLMIEVAQGGAPHENVCHALEVFAREVMPHFKKERVAA
ncbi:LLM class flavin-dependent oxidoreductase [Novosphingobium bradum]|uniref:LLM class flavin-dependent oxidoreductase n=1 Tax=Novosphingobium bradum TaxID=1737444 RepID=A0ABV7ILZ2_9SPHN